MIHSEPIIVTLLAVLFIVFAGWSVIFCVKKTANYIKTKFNIKNNNIERLISLFENGTKIILFLLFINIGISFVNIPEKYLLNIEKLLYLISIVAFTWIVLKVLHIIKFAILQKNSKQYANLSQYKMISTQVTVIERVVSAIVIIISSAIMLMSFDRLREIGQALLASAGLIAAVATFAANKTLSSIISGIQIAITQPIRIDDIVVIENELGSIEDISLTYVTIKLWDLRRFIIPINYFLENSFRNLTRDTKSLLGFANLYTDYTVPLDDIRKKYLEIMNSTNLWDKTLAKLQISDAKEHTIEIRLFISAKNPAELWDLQCLVREKMIKYIHEKYFHCLPKIRIKQESH